MSGMYFRLMVSVALCILCSAVFYLYPEIDLKFSMIFYDPEDGFYLSHSNWLHLLEKMPKMLAIGVLFLMALLALLTFFYTRSLEYKHYVAHLYIAIVFILGTIIVVDQGLKEYSGRARPYQVEEFGGYKQFTGAYHKAAECAGNCSFVSAHAAAAFAFVGFAFVVRNRHKRALIEISALVWGLVAGFARIVDGKHFLSDIILCGMYIYILAVVLAIIMKPSKSGLLSR